MLHVESTNSTDAKDLFEIYLSSLSPISLFADNVRCHFSGLQAKVKAEAVHSHSITF